MPRARGMVMSPVRTQETVRHGGLLLPAARASPVATSRRTHPKPDCVTHRRPPRRSGPGTTRVRKWSRGLVAATQACSTAPRPDRSSRRAGSSSRRGNGGSSSTGCGRRPPSGSPSRSGRLGPPRGGEHRVSRERGDGMGYSRRGARRRAGRRRARGTALAGELCGSATEIARV